MDIDIVVTEKGSGIVVDSRYRYKLENVNAKNFLMGKFEQVADDLFGPDEPAKK